MSTQDARMLQDFLAQLVQARGVRKDPEADALIQRAVAQQPDAAYLLVQRALLVGQALENAKDRIAALEEQLREAQAQAQQQGQQGGRFLDADSWGNSGTARPAAQQQGYARDLQQAYPSQSQPPQYQPQYPSQPQYQSAPRSGFLSGGFGSALGTMAATAAGVAAGGFLFQGLENMFNHNEHGGGGNHLLNGDDPGNNLFGNNDQSGSSLASQAGLGDVDRALDNGGGQGLFDADNTSIDGGDGFFDGDGSDEGLFS
ncbi:DUF2076 domain-containing protein [uncultured Massilia sp.]|uniref:DUF2076 domain-containing protein n=1 Tax=uncultured Massilia sp. TaxID=169973 RepID=UPI0025EAC7B5|nr:DUF2076 domain-containing protein [uncultured Massilia sp.]